MKRTWLWIILVFLVLVLGAELFFYFLWPKIKPITDLSKINPVDTTSQTPNPVNSVKSVVVTDAGVTWITPQKLNDLGLTVKPSVNDGIDTTSTYYKIADLSGNGELILDVYQPDCPCSPEMLRFKKDATGTYTYLLKQSDDKDSSSYSQILDKKVTVDYGTSYQSLSAPDFITVQGETLKDGGYNGLFADISANTTEIGAIDYGKVFRNKINNSTDSVSGINYALKLADSTYESYVIKFPFIPDNEVATVTWSDNTKNADKFTAEGYAHCGMIASDNVVIDTKNLDSRLKSAGKTDSGDTIYTVSANDAIMQSAYDNYKTGRDKDILTIDQFAAKKAMFVWKSKLGDYVVFTDRNFGGLAECGKPVIYLYPTQAETVSVKVGATITKSEPAYDRGWQVFAEPSGKLTVNNKVYDSLFWEGQGQVYPLVDSGFVVAQKDLENTLRDQTLKLGLNQKESADFMAFWLPKMPKTPFVRLTWFGTNEVNKLAPLSITPKPDTIIRIFLDFQGLSQPITLKPQKLVAIPRQGFTVIEWGGLLQ